MEHQQQEHEDIMEAPGIDDEMLVELLDASTVATDEEEAENEQAAGGRHGQQQQLGFAADDDVGDGWVGSLELNSSIHPHQEGCEDCGLDDILSDFEGCGSSPAPYVDVEDGNPADYYWMEEMGAATGDCCAGEWYMDGMVMEWDDGRSYYSFYPSNGGDTCIDQLYASPLWE